MYRNNGDRFKNYYKWEKSVQTPYKYDRDGLCKHILSRRVAETENPFLRVILVHYENSISFVLRYIDKLKHFKNFYWSNR